MQSEIINYNKLNQIYTPFNIILFLALTKKVKSFKCTNENFHSSGQTLYQNYLNKDERIVLKMLMKGQTLIKQTATGK